jgi:hypothetical protein
MTGSQRVTLAASACQAVHDLNQLAMRGAGRVAELVDGMLVRPQQFADPLSHYAEQSQIAVLESSHVTLARAPVSCFSMRATTARYTRAASRDADIAATMSASKSRKR